MQRILGIDPGYDRLGIAVIDHDNSGKDSFIFSDCVQTNKKDSHAIRLQTIGTSLQKTIAEYQPDVVVLEKLYFSKNQKTALLVAEARGVLLFVSQNAGVNIFEYNPSDIKIATTGYGRSDKKQVIAMVSQLIKIPKKIKHDDEYDAIAVAITHGATKHF